MASGSSMALNITQRIRETETKWTPFRRRHFKCIFLNENVWISMKISLKFVPKGLINNIPALAQIVVWRRPGDKPLSEAMMVNLPTHICVSLPQWFKPWIPLLIILSLVCESNIKEVHCRIRCSKRMSVDRNILGRWINVEAVVQTLIFLF